MAKRITQRMVEERIRRLIDANKLDYCTLKVERNPNNRYCALRFYGEDNHGDVKFDYLAECWEWLDYFDTVEVNNGPT